MTICRYAKNVILCMSIVALMLAAVSFQGVRAASPPVLKMPTQPVTVLYGPWLAGTKNSTMDVTLSGVGAGFDVHNGIYPGWCIQDFVSGSPSSAMLYSSYGSMPSDVAPLLWNKINYVLNHKQGSINDVQIAVWQLTGNPLPTSIGPVTPAVQAMLDAANANPGFVPLSGQVVAVIVYSDGIVNRDASSFQEAIIEVLVPPQPAISIVKYTNGQVASDPNGSDVPQIKPGDPVTWTYRVTNTGQVSIPLANVSVTDDQLGVSPTFDSYLSGNSDAMFDPGEVWLYKATGIAVNLLAESPGVKFVENSCTHNGTQPARRGYVNNGTATIPGATSTAQSHYCNPPVPAISITKYTNGQVASAPNGGDVPEIKPGDPVTWTYRVTNIGQVSVPRASVFVTDDQPGVSPTFDSELSGNGDTVFDPGEVWLYKATGIAVDLQAANPPVTVIPAVCTHNGTQPPRTGYVNNGTATIPGATSTAQSHYCNPPSGPGIYKIYLPIAASGAWQVSVGFEDLPEMGSNDFDYNDWLVDMHATVINDSIIQNGVSRLTFRFLPHARGAAYTHAFHMRFAPNVFASDGTAVLTTYDPSGNVLSITQTIFTAASANDFEIFPDTAVVFPGSIVDTLEGRPFIEPQRTAELSIQFAASFPFDISSYDPGRTHPHGDGLFFDPYLHVIQTPPYDIHKGDVRMLTVPDTDYLWPEERVQIDRAYPDVTFIPGSPPNITFPLNWWLNPNHCVYDGVPCQ